jgi:2-polyprenyl-6-methoxyphenol hydroxylase-like FAD-dependent oxidoreductase
MPLGDNAPHNPSLEYFQTLLDANNPWGVKVTISSIVASSKYRIRSAVASTYFHKVGDGNILLAGDAAHVHSPAGGQGMNLGICDAIAVAHAIHSHSTTDAESRDIVLQHYADSRRKTGVKVIRLASNLTTLMSAGAGWRRVVRNLALLIARHLPFVVRAGALNISGIANRSK